MTTGISVRSLDIESRRALSSARSGEPGAYRRMGSFTGAGTRRWPVTLLTATDDPEPVVGGTDVDEGWLSVGVDIAIPEYYV
jgi:hypothetical protein